MDLEVLHSGQRIWGSFTVEGRVWRSFTVQVNWYLMDVQANTRQKREACVLAQRNVTAKPVGHYL